MVAGVELPIDRGASAIEMAEAIFGEGVTVVSATYTGDPDSSGICTNGGSIAPWVTPSDTGVMFSTGDLRGFTNNSWQSNLSSSTTTASGGPKNDPAFDAAAGTGTYDASYIDVDFIPTGSVMTIQFVFSSEEYPEYATGAYQDFVAARDLVDDRSVGPVEGGAVKYVHILFERHQVVYSEGLATESFYPGQQTVRSFETEIVREICTLFPELDPENGAGYSPAARRTLRRHEAQLLLGLGAEAA